MKLLVAAIALATGLGDAHARPPTADAVLLPNGLALPYPALRVFRGFGRCLGRGQRPAKWDGAHAWKSHEHEGLDLGGLGPDGGLGSAVRSLTRARVTAIARTADDPARYGYPDEREGDATRGLDAFPRAFDLAGYGHVTFFTRAKGYWRTGNMVVTVGVGGPLDGHEIRYMHLGAARPDLVVGAELAPGEELGVLGGTSVQDAAPHVHIDIRDRDGESVDVAPLIGLVPSAWCGVPRTRALADWAAFKAAAAALGKPWRAETWAPPVGAPGVAPSARVLPTVDLLRTPEPLLAAGVVARGARFWHDVIIMRPCGATVVEEDFASGAYAGHAWRIPVQAGESLDVTVVASARDAAPPRFYATAGASVVSSDASGGRTRVEVGENREVFVDVLAGERAAGDAGDYRVTVFERCRPH